MIVVAYGLGHLHLGWIPDDAPVVVVHNDDQLPEHACGHPRVRHLYPGANLGFGRGVNLALAEVRTRRVVIVNPDVELERLHWSALAGGAANEVVTVPLVGVEGNPMASVLPYPSPAMLTVSSLQLMRLAPPGSIRRRALGTVLGSWGDERRWSTPTPPGRYPLDTFWIPAAVFSVDTDLLRRIGGFDTDYFLYLEDTDLCHRINRQSPGALAAVADTEPGFHEVGGSAHTSGASQLARRSQWDSAVTYAAREAGWQWRCAELAIRGGRFVTSLGDRTGELPPWDGTPAPRPGADQGRTRS
ncbi:MAG: glycosyltransferase family 2 protein [Acidimicrobiales bacterium]